MVAAGVSMRVDVGAKSRVREVLGAKSGGK